MEPETRELILHFIHIIIYFIFGKYVLQVNVRNNHFFVFSFIYMYRSFYRWINSF